MCSADADADLAELVKSRISFYSPVKNNVKDAATKQVTRSVDSNVAYARLLPTPRFTAACHSHPLLKLTAYCPFGVLSRGSASVKVRCLGAPQ